MATMVSSKARQIHFDRGEQVQLFLAVAVASSSVATGIMAWRAGVLPAAGPWPDWGTFSIIMALALLSVLVAGVRLFRSASNRQKLQDNSDILKELLEGQKEMAAVLKEITLLLKAGALAGAPGAAPGVPPSTTITAAAVGGGGRSGNSGADGRIVAIEGEVERLRAKVEALKGGTGGIPR